jgi:methyl-accepting chemotaxis protein
MKLRLKLLSAPLLTAVVMLGAGRVDALLSAHNAAAERSAEQARLQHLKTVSSLQDQLSLAHASVYRTLTLIASLDDNKIKAVRTELAQELERIKRSFAEVAAGYPQDAALQTAVAEIGDSLDQYRKQTDAAIDLSSVDPNTGVAAMQTADATFSDLARHVRAVVTHIDEASDAQAVASAIRTTHQNMLFAAIALMMAAVAVGVSWLLQRHLVADLAAAGRIATRVADGRLDAVPSSTREDEVGDVLRALSNMTTELNATLRTVRDSSASIHTASVEITRGNYDLSSRTEETASSLEQTAVAIKQFSGSIMQTAESAQQAREFASSSADVARRGGMVVAQVVSTMDEIRANSRTIGDIVATIDSIAFQTNLLALNAAVEAARAGEQGRGFAVVASEVRNLAQRSADAAKQIRTMIGASVNRVESGAKLVADAGTTMTDIVVSVQRVSDIIARISEAAVEQTQGIDQINGAVGSLEQMTQQNAALVEQSAAAADMLKDQASRLDALVRHFALADATVSVKADGLAAAAAAAATAAATHAPEDVNSGGGAEAALRSDWRLMARAS